jgi:hypothetical protein
MRYFAAFFFRFGLLNGSSGSALFGTDRIVLTALRNRFIASGPSFISALRGAMASSLPLQRMNLNLRIASGCRSVKRFGVPGRGMWLGEDGIWRFEDSSTYLLSEDRIPVPSDATNHPGLRKIFPQFWGIAASRIGISFRAAASLIRLLLRPHV